jgi:hypothetical protein
MKIDPGVYLLAFLFAIYLGVVGVFKDSDQEKKKAARPTVVCFDEVEYFHNYRGILTPHFHPDGTLYTCNPSMIPYTHTALQHK